MMTECTCKGKLDTEIIVSGVEYEEDAKKVAMERVVEGLNDGEEVIEITCNDGKMDGEVTWDDYRKANDICHPMRTLDGCRFGAVDVERIDPDITCKWTQLEQQLEIREKVTYLTIGSLGSEWSCNVMPSNSREVKLI